MKPSVLGIRSSGIYGRSPDRRSRRLLARLLELSAIVALAVTLTPAPVAAAAAPPQPQAAAAAGDWPQFRNGPRHQGYDSQEQELSASNVSGLGLAWINNLGDGISSSPAVANGMVYVGSMGGRLFAHAAGCASGGKECLPAWTATITGAFYSSPAVANGVVFIGSENGLLYAFDAAGVTKCTSNLLGTHCDPLWTGQTGGVIDSSPTVSGGVVYVGSQDERLYAFDANGVTGCSGNPKTCLPLWTTTTVTGGSIYSSPAVANGVAYVGSVDGHLYAFDAAGVTNCSGSPKACSPLWSATVGGAINSSPAVANGVVYVGSVDHKLYAFDANGVTGCSGGHCSPLWTATTGNNVDSSPAVANGVVYVGSWDGKLYAFDAAGITGCSGGTCSPLWTALTGGAIQSSPAVANGVVYIGSYDDKLYAFDSAGLSHCSGSPKACSPLWSYATGNLIHSSPAVANGVVYVGSWDDNLYAFDLESTYHPMTPPARLLDTRNGTGLSGKLSANTPATFTVAGRGGVPANASAVTGNVTVVNSTNSWAVYLGPNPIASPTTSTINFAAGEVTGNGLTVALGAGGTLSATYMSTAGNTTDLVFDVTGYFTPNTTGATYHPISPARLLDTRNGTGLSGKLSANTPATFAVAGQGGIPANATAVTGNVTVVNSTFSWAVYLGPVATASPTTSTINFNTGQVKGNSLTVALSANGKLSATYMSTAGNTTDLVFDVTGYYTADATGAVFVPINPARLLDTRVANGLSSKLAANTPATFSVAGRGGVPSYASAVTGNVTVVNETFSWAVFLGPVPTASPTTSTINFNTGDVKGNGLTVALGSGGTLSATYMSTAGNTTDLVFDVTGYYEP